MVLSWGKILSLYQQLGGYRQSDCRTCVEIESDFGSDLLGQHVDDVARVDEIFG